MHINNRSRKPSPNYAVIAVIVGVVLFILFVSYFQLNRTLDAMKTHNEKQQQQRKEENDFSEHQLNQFHRENNKDDDRGFEILHDVVDVANAKPQQSTKK